MARFGIAESSHAYRNQARRLRCRYAGQPGRLYRSLRDLSDRHDADSRRFSRVPNNIAPSASIESEAISASFAHAVQSCLSEGALCYSRRQQLLAAAQKSGIGRFHANLIIAAVQHEYGNGQAIADKSSATPTWPKVLFLVLLIQTTIISAAWLLFCHA